MTYNRSQMVSCEWPTCTGEATTWEDMKLLLVQAGIQHTCCTNRAHLHCNRRKAHMPYLEMLAYPAKYGVLVVKPWSWHSGDEELAAIGVGASIGHAEGEGPIVPQAAIKLVLKLTPPN